MSETGYTTTHFDGIKSDQADAKKTRVHAPRTRQLSEIEIIRRFCDAARDIGLEISPSEVIPNTEEFQRWRTVNGKNSRKRNGFTKLHIDDGAGGTFGNWSTGETIKWSIDTGAAPMSAEEKAFQREQWNREKAARAVKRKEKQDQAAERAKKHWDKAVPADDSHPYLRRKGVKAHGLRIGRWWGRDDETGKPYVVCERTLLVPKYDLKRNIRSLQAIFPEKINLDGEEIDKLYLGGGEKDGLFHAIGTPLDIGGRKVFIVAEGLATASSIHEATGHCVLVAFDTGNLLHTAKVVRGKYGDAIIVFAADNDWGTIAPVNNPGVHHARKAATAVGGVVAVPQFTDTSDMPKGGDFNDLYQREGAGAVEACINAALHPPKAPDQAKDMPLGGDDQHPTEARAEPRNKPATQDEAEELAVQKMEEQAGFRILGHHREKVFIFVHGMRQIIERETFTLTTLVHMAPLSWWEDTFPGKGNGGSVNINQAVEFIIRTAQRRGLYDPNCVRNGGAWMDAGRHVFHHGNFLTVDGKRTPVTSIRSKFIYEQTPPLPTPADVSLTDAEGQHIYDIAKTFRWQRDSSAALLAGWTFLAPICGALKWRPHIFLTGPAGNGKSTILRDYVHALIGEGGCVYAQGSSTEAGVRQDIGSTSLPCLIDEAERNTEREQQRIEALLALIRQSSTESAAKTLKGTVGGEGMKFNVRSMFALAAIFPGLARKADIDRLSVLSLKPLRGDLTASAHWKVVEDLLHQLGDEDANVRGKVMRRTLDMLPTILKSIEVFKRVAAEKFGSQRDGDQFGTMLAGAWSLTNSAIATPEQALEMMDGMDWSEYTETASDADDSDGALRELMGAFITVHGVKHSVHNLISFALGEEVEGRTLEAGPAKAELRQHGIGLDGNKLVLSNSSSAIKKLLHGTSYATDPRAAFERLPGAVKGGKKQATFNGQQTRITMLPLSAIGLGAKSIKSERDLF